ncbi:YbjN domain-containing protein [Paraferrimonas sp. SM1919]|uniref:YbjN domain-containing protein n=1 Tax=Paraferrimonas sp. SM1919 TaxID=2662263 RepID=UPI0013CF80C3|nr:YbjN domain-containing protein [Paraferrimonas sp. SM1919]
MKINTILILLSALISGCASTQPSTRTDVIEFLDSAPQQAVDKLYQGLLHHNYLAQKIEGKGVVVQFDSTQMILQPAISNQKDGIDRIVVNQYFGVHPKFVGNRQLLALVANLNRQLTFAKFVFTQGGQVILVQSSMTFIEDLDLEELRRFMLWVDEGLRQVGTNLPPQMATIIIPLPLMKSGQAL